MDPVSLSSLGAEALRLGVQFLYNQAGETIKWWRDHRDGDRSAPVALGAGADEALAEPPASLEMDASAMGELGDKIDRLRGELTGFTDGKYEVDSTDPRLLEAADALRLALESVTHSDLTFRGEQRATSDMKAQMEVREVSGYLAGVLAKGPIEGKLTIDIKVDKVKDEGRVVGFDFTGEK